MFSGGDVYHYRCERKSESGLTVFWGRFWGKMTLGARFGAIKCPYLSAIVQDSGEE